MSQQSAMVQGLLRLRDAGFSPSGILDIGAHDGHFAREARQVYGDAHLLMIDALAEKEAVLADVAREIGNASHAIALLGEREAEATPFFVVDTEQRPDLVKTGSSTFRENTRFPVRERLVPQVTLAKLLRDRGRVFSLVKLDIQGAELAALRGLGYLLSTVEVIVMEMSLVDYNKGAPLIDAVLGELRAMGFVLCDIVEQHRYRDRRLLQIDGVFVRPDSRFRPQPPFWT